MKIDIGNGQFLNVRTVPNTCDKCAHCDWATPTPSGLPTCKITHKNVLIERALDGSCTSAGLNFKAI